MKSKLKKQYIIPAVIGGAILLTLIAVFIAYKTRYNGIKDIYYSNEQTFERLAALAKEHTGERSRTVIRTDETGCDKQISDILGELRDKYHKDSDFPAFSSVTVVCDKNGRSAVSVAARQEKLSGDGANSHDVRCYELVYIDEDFDFSSAGGQHLPSENDEPFSGNWHVWCYDTYSG